MKKIALLSLAASLAIAASATAEMVELELELPKPMFVGTPTNISSDNLEPTTGESRPPLMVPEDVTNVAAGKFVSSSDPMPIIGELDQITDGDKEGADGSYIEIGPGPQWVQIDLGEEYELHAVVLWHFHSQARAYRDVVVQASTDEDLLEGTTTIFNNDHDNSLGLGLGEDKEWIETYEGRAIPAKGAVARYVRVYSNGSTASPMSHYVEVEVYGRSPAN